MKEILWNFHNSCHCCSNKVTFCCNSSLTCYVDAWRQIFRSTDCFFCFLAAMKCVTLVIILCSFPTKLTPRRSVPYLLKLFTCPSFVFRELQTSDLEKVNFGCWNSEWKAAVTSCDLSMMSRNVPITRLPPICKQSLHTDLSCITESKRQLL